MTHLNDYEGLLEDAAPSFGERALKWFRDPRHLLVIGIIVVAVVVGALAVRALVSTPRPTTVVTITPTQTPSTPPPTWSYPPITPSAHDATENNQGTVPDEAPLPAQEDSSGAEQPIPAEPQDVPEENAAPSQQDQAPADPVEPVQPQPDEGNDGTAPDSGAAPDTGTNDTGAVGVPVDGGSGNAAGQATGTQ